MSNDFAVAVTSAEKAFAAIARQGVLAEVKSVEAIATTGHVQGLVRWDRYWIASYSNPTGTRGWLCVMDALTQEFLGKSETPEGTGPLDHPGGMQVCGDYLFVALQELGPFSGKAGYGQVLVYDLTLMKNGKMGPPATTRVKHRPGDPGAVGVVDIVDPASPRGRSHLLAVHDNAKLTFYLTSGEPLSNATFAPTRGEVQTLQHSQAESIALIKEGTGAKERVFLVTMESYGEGTSYKDVLKLWAVPIDMTKRTVGPVTQVGEELHLFTRHGAVRGAAGVHFRYGGGLRVMADGTLEVLATQMHLAWGSKFGLDVFQDPGLPLKVLVHVQSKGDMTFRENELAGTTGKSLRLEGFQIALAETIPGVSLEYTARVQGMSDDGEPVPGGMFAGTRGQSKALEGFAIKLVGPKSGSYDVWYAAHLQSTGTTPLVSNGAFCGTRGLSKRVEAILVRVTKKNV